MSDIPTAASELAMVLRGLVLGHPLGSAMALVSVGMLLMLRRWSKSDRATRSIRAAGLKVEKHQTQRLRDDLLEIAMQQARDVQEAKSRFHLRVEEIKLERDRLHKLVQTNPDAIKSVGRALRSAERDYHHSLGEIESEQARAVLRMATERRIRDICKSVSDDVPALPRFQLPRDEAT